MSEQEYYLRDTCRMCTSQSLKKVVELTPTPPGNNFLKNLEDVGSEKIYPLELYFCGECFHVQLGHVVDPAILYQQDYTYVSATSSQFVNYLNDYANTMIERFDIKEGSLVADIGSNDGTCLSFFQRAGMEVVGVDPAEKIAARANQNGIKTIADFFSYDLAKELRENFGAASFITSHNACAHIDNLDNVVRGVAHWLDDDGIFVLEVGYFLDVYNNIWFDTIYHEHLDYHTVAPFEKFFKRLGMELIGVQRVSPQGGSIRIMAQKVGGRCSPDYKSIQVLIQLEREAGLYGIDAFTNFQSRVNKVKEDLNDLISALKAKSKSIAGFGAPTKATTLLSYFNLGQDVLEFIVDENPLKQGLYTPATHIPVLPAAEIYEKKPDYLLILAWNFASPIMKNFKEYSDGGGKFIIPMPIPTIV